jgi:hypothetical protein
MKNINFDYVSFGQKAVEVSVTVAAVVVAVTSYAYLAFQLWWDENGEDVKALVPVVRERLLDLSVGFRKAVVLTYEAGRGSAQLLSRGADFVYFAAADI